MCRHSGQANYFTNYKKITLEVYEPQRIHSVGVLLGSSSLVGMVSKFDASISSGADNTVLTTGLLGARAFITSIILLNLCCKNSFFLCSAST